MMLRKKFIATAMSAVLAVSLCPGLAMADSLTGGAVDTSSSSAPAKVSTQAKKTVYVLDGYSYNSRGLLDNYGGYDLKYKGNNLKSAKASKYSKISFKSSNGKIKKATAIYKSSSNKKDRSKTKYTYSYNGNKIANVKTVGYSTNPYNNKYYKKAKKYMVGNTAYTTNSKGSITREVYSYARTDGAAAVSAPQKYKYDAKGNLKLSKRGKYAGTKYINKYTKGRLTSRTVKYYNSEDQKWETSYTNKYTYTKIKVPASAVKTVKAQQWALLNYNNNAALGPLDSYYYYY